MANELIINASLPETRIALMEDGEIKELLVERASEKGIVGNVYKGRVTRVLPGMQAAFVDIGLDKAAFLYVDDVYVHSEMIEEAGAHVMGSGVAEHDELPHELIEDGHSEEPVEMGPPPQGSEGDEDSDGPQEGNLAHEDPKDFPGTIASTENQTLAPDARAGVTEPPTSQSTSQPGQPGQSGQNYSSHNRNPQQNRRPHRRGRRGMGGRFQKKSMDQGKAKSIENYPENYKEQMADPGNLASDRSDLDQSGAALASEVEEGRPHNPQSFTNDEKRHPSTYPQPNEVKTELKMQRSQDRRIRPKQVIREPRSQVNIQDLLKEGQEVLVQVAKDPIATKGARLTCHISLPGRHLVCMPTIDHVGVSRRIERDDERRRLRDFVERNRPKNLGFIVRTASGRQQSERRIQQDIDYLTHLWNQIKEKAAEVSAPSLVYEDLNSILRAIRDWVTEEIDKVIVDSRFHYQEIQKFVSYFMPPLKQKIELYHGDIPIFDAYGISTELSRALERKVWLKSGGYIVVDQAEALVAIDVNTGRYVGKKNLEDTILKTNLEAVREIAYQLRLRNCGGIIILDLIDMEKEENKQRVYRALEDALSRDRARPSILKISELGLVEMTRKRTRDTMVRSLCESCPHCEGKGFIKSKQTVAYEVLREVEREGIERDVAKILVQAHPEVIDILAIDERETLDQLEKRYRKLIYLQAVPNFHPEQFEVSADKRPRLDRGEHKLEHKRHSEHRNDRKMNESKAHENRNSDRNLSSNADRHHDRQASVALAQAAQANAVQENTQQADTQVDVQGSALGNTPDEMKKKDGDDFFDEEDRLAFLRAQAAQDAALARLNQNGSHPQAEAANRGAAMNNNSRRHPRNGHPGGKKNGKFRRGGGHDRHRNHQRYGFQSKKPAANPPAESPSSTSDSGSSNTPNDGSSGGGGDYSQPPS